MPQTGIAAGSTAGRAASDLAAILADCQGARRSVFLFGSEQREIYRLREVVSAGFPALKLAGICDADFDGPASREIVAHIAKSSPDTVVVDMPPRDFLRFARDHACDLPASALVNLPGGFRRHLRDVERPRVGGRFALPRFLRSAADGGGLVRIVLGQALRGTSLRGR